jgi:DNA-binding CsgD family transcriptional regulator
MKPPLFIQSFSAAEHRVLEAALRSRDAFTLRRAQILRASARGDRPSQIAAYLGCSTRLGKLWSKVVW